MFLLSREGSETITFLWPKWCKRLIQRFPIIPAPRTRILESAVTEPVFCNLFQSVSCGTMGLASFRKSCAVLNKTCLHLFANTSCGQVPGKILEFVEYRWRNSKLVATHTLKFSRAWIWAQFGVEICSWLYMKHAHTIQVAHKLQTRSVVAKCVRCNSKLVMTHTDLTFSRASVAAQIAGFLSCKSCSFF